MVSSQRCPKSVARTVSEHREQRRLSQPVLRTPLSKHPWDKLVSSNCEKCFLNHLWRPVVHWTFECGHLQKHTLWVCRTMSLSPLWCIYLLPSQKEEWKKLWRVNSAIFVHSCFATEGLEISHHFSRGNQNLVSVNKNILYVNSILSGVYKTALLQKIVLIMFF